MTRTAPHSAGLKGRLERAMAIALGVSLFTLLPLFVVPVLAAFNCPDKGNVSNASISPGSGTTSTAFTFAITYQDIHEEPPVRVWARFVGGPDITDLFGSGNLKTGVVYAGTSTLPAGSWMISLRVTPAGTTQTCRLDVAVAVAVAPTPTPAPTPKPTPKPVVTPKPTVKPRATPKPTATVKPTAEPKPSATPNPTKVAVVDPATPKPPAAEAAPRPRPTKSPVALVGAAGSTRGTGGSESSGDGGPMGGFGMIVGAVTSPNPLLAWLIASAGGVALYLFLLRRSRDVDPDTDPELRRAVPAVASAGASATPTRRASVIAPPPKLSVGRNAKAKAKPARATASASPAGAGSPVTTAPPKAAPTAAPDDSLPLAATLAAAAERTAAAAKSTDQAKKFDKPAARNVQRYTVAYRHVRISATSDEFRSQELGRLDRGDEVELIDSFEGALQVRTPDGVVGWIPRQTIVG